MLKFIRAKRAMPILFIGITIFAFSCQKDSSSLPESYNSYQDVTIKNVSYGSDTSQVMDVYLPANRTVNTTKILIMVHGGSWNEGDRQDFNGAIDSLKPLLPNYAIFNINYRLAANGHNLFPAAVNDVALAIKFIGSKAKIYEADTQKVAIGGASAGAHLAMLQAYSVHSASIKAVVDLFGPTNLTRLYNNHPVPQFAQAVLVNFLGVPLLQNPSLYEQASPVSFISVVSPPTIIFHGDADPVVPIEQSNELQAKLNSFNVSNSFIIYPGEGHGWSDGKLYKDTYQKIADFLKLHME